MCSLHRAAHGNMTARHAFHINALEKRYLCVTRRGTARCNDLASPTAPPLEVAAWVIAAAPLRTSFTRPLSTRGALARPLVDPVHLVGLHLRVGEQALVKQLDDGWHVHLDTNEDKLLPMVAPGLFKVLHDPLDLLGIRRPLVT